MFQSVFDVHYTLKLVNHNPPLQINFVGMDFHGFFRSICQFTLGIFIHHKLCVIYYIILYYIILYYIVLYYMLFCYIILYCIIFYYIHFTRKMCLSHMCHGVKSRIIYKTIHIVFTYIHFIICVYIYIYIVYIYIYIIYTYIYIYIHPIYIYTIYIYIHNYIYNIYPHNYVFMYTYLYYWLLLGDGHTTIPFGNSDGFFTGFSTLVGFS